MNFSKFAKIIGVGIVALAFTVTYCDAKPNGEKPNNGKSNAQQQDHKSEKNNPSQNEPKKADNPIKSPNAKSLTATPPSITIRTKSISRDKDASQTKALRPNVQRRFDHQISHNVQKRNQTLIKDLNRSLLKLNNSKWSYNPHDDRGQGNMGKVDMLDPFGHDKDSNRKILYGNNGRVIKQIAPEPEPEPDPIPEPEPQPDPIPEPVPEPEPEPLPEPAPEPAPAPDPIPEPAPEPAPAPDPIPEFPF